MRKQLPKTQKYYWLENRCKIASKKVDNCNGTETTIKILQMSTKELQLNTKISETTTGTRNFNMGTRKVERPKTANQRL